MGTGINQWDVNTNAHDQRGAKKITLTPRKHQDEYPSTWLMSERDEDNNTGIYVDIPQKELHIKHHNGKRLLGGSSFSVKRGHIGPHKEEEECVIDEYEYGQETKGEKMVNTTEVQKSAMPHPSSFYITTDEDIPVQWKFKYESMKVQTNASGGGLKWPWMDYDE